MVPRELPSFCVGWAADPVGRLDCNMGVVRSPPPPPGSDRVPLCCAIRSPPIAPARGRPSGSVSAPQLQAEPVPDSERIGSFLARRGWSRCADAGPATLLSRLPGCCGARGNLLAAFRSLESLFWSRATGIRGRLGVTQERRMRSRSQFRRSRPDLVRICRGLQHRLRGPGRRRKSVLGELW